MHLKELRLQGFKSFANKTILKFDRGLTAVVGPNGSGKSNIADAIRWVLGTQSMKSIRSKKSADVIFAGSTAKARMSMAEVAVHFDNSDHALPIDFPEVIISRRLFRDGETEFLINNSTVRLKDIHELLAQGGVGQRTYSVVGQGMIDSFLYMSSAERKEMFDEASGIKPFEMKKEAAERDLGKARENLHHINDLLREQEPLLRNLREQAEKAREREALLGELKTARETWFGTSWQLLQTQFKTVSARKADLAKELLESGTESQRLNTQLQQLQESLTTENTPLAPLQQGLRQLHAERQQLEKALAVAEGQEQLLQKQKEQAAMLQNQISQARQAALATEEQIKIIASSPAELNRAVDLLLSKQELLLQELQVAKSLGELKPIVTRLKKLVNDFRQLFTNTNSANKAKLIEELTVHRTELAKAEYALSLQEKPAAGSDQAQGLRKRLLPLEQQIKEKEDQLASLGQQDQKQREQFFQIENKYRELQQAVTQKREKFTAVEIEFATVSEKITELVKTLTADIGTVAAELWQRRADRFTVPPDSHPTVLGENMLRIKHRLEAIGEIGTDTLKSHQEIEARHQKMTSETEDLKITSKKLHETIKELEVQIREHFEIAFQKINREFTKFFQLLFGGGSARLVLRYVVEEERGAKPVPTIEIQATPPGKKLKNIGMLSGGEKSLTSIALLAAILANNPSPFIVLDEADAALDEANSRRFAQVLATLCRTSQFITITHNRETMKQAQMLYGVTMEASGVSRLLSMKFEQAEKIAGKTPALDKAK